MMYFMIVSLTRTKLCHPHAQESDWGDDWISSFVFLSLALALLVNLICESLRKHRRGPGELTNQSALFDDNLHSYFLPLHSSIAIRVYCLASALIKYTKLLIYFGSDLQNTLNAWVGQLFDKIDCSSVPYYGFRIWINMAWNLNLCIHMGQLLKQHQKPRQFKKKIDV